MVVFSALSLTLHSFALNVKGFEVGVVYAVWSGVGMAFNVTIEIIWKQREKWNDKDIGPIGTMARIGLGLGFVGSVVHGQIRNAPCPRQPSHSASLASPLSCRPGTGGIFAATRHLSTTPAR